MVSSVKQPLYSKMKLVPLDFSYTVPSSAPLNFHAVDISSSNFTLIWEPLAPSERNGIITGYNITVTSLSSPHEDPKLFFTSTESLTVDLLSPHTEYICIIAASTAIGTGPYSTELNARTGQNGMFLFLIFTRIPSKEFSSCSTWGFSE